MKVPKWLSNLLDEDGYSKIQSAVKEAETKTSGEIVPMIVKKSATTGHVQGFLTSILLLIALALYIALIDYDLIPYPQYCLIGAIILMAVLGYFLSALDTFQRLFVSQDDRAHQVNIRAEVEFYEAGLNETRDATGILLLVSMMEHRAVVLADKAIADKLPEETWNEVCSMLVEGMKSGELVGGFVKGIEKCGEILAEHFPIKPDDTNELKDGLVFKE